VPPTIGPLTTAAGPVVGRVAVLNGAEGVTVVGGGCDVDEQAPISRARSAAGPATTRRGRQ